MAAACTRLETPSLRRMLLTCTLVVVIHHPGLAAQYASRTIQVADGPIASGVDAGAR